MTDVITGETVKRSDTHDVVRLDELDEQLIGQLVDRARSEALRLTGEDGLLAQLTKTIIESAAEGEMDAHLGYAKHDPAGRDGGNSRNGGRTKSVLTDIDAELAANPRQLGEAAPLELSAADHALREMVADAIDRKLWLSNAYEATEDVALRVKLCTQLRLTEQAAARWLRQLDLDLPQPMSRTSQKAQQAANVRHHGRRG